MNLVAVVPIFTSAGVALLPTIVAAIASMAAIVLKPRELLRLGRRRPLAVSAAVGATALGLAAAWLLASGTSPRAPARAESRTGGHYDWAKVAEAIITQERIAKAPTSQILDTPPDAARVLGARFFPLLLRGRALAAGAQAAVVLPSRGHDVPFQPCGGR